jgi:hypothetical protein
MNRFVRLTVIASALALPLGGCSSLPGLNTDPTDWFNVDFFNNKKPLPGERKPVFPDGVPGVTHGVPPDMVKGYQPPPETGLAQGQNPEEGGSPQPTSLRGSEETPQAEQAAANEEPAPPPKPKAKAKPKTKPKAKKVAAKPAPVMEDPQPSEPPPAAVTVERSQPQWPEPPPPRQQPAASQWPAAPSTQNATPGVQWPEPPAPR